MYLQRPGTNLFETFFNAILSTEKKQDGRIVHTNIEMVLQHIERDMAKASAQGATVVAIDTIIDNSDGCAVQYRCGTALFMLWQFSMERQLVYDKNIDETGHGKSIVDSKNGQNKGNLNKGLRGNATSQPECFVEGKNTIVYVDMDENGKKVDFADVAAKYLNNDTLSGKVPANNPQSADEDESVTM